MYEFGNHFDVCYCPKCVRVFENDLNFCFNCGSKTLNTKKTFCNKCNKEYYNGKNTCDKCSNNTTKSVKKEDLIYVCKFCDKESTWEELPYHAGLEVCSECHNRKKEIENKKERLENRKTYAIWGLIAGLCFTIYYFNNLAL